MQRSSISRIEENDRQRQRADDIGQGEVREFYAETVDPGGKPDRQEEKKERCAEAKGDEARKCGQENQGRCNQRDRVKLTQSSSPFQYGPRGRTQDCPFPRAGCQTETVVETRRHGGRCFATRKVRCIAEWLHKYGTRS